MKMQREVYDAVRRDKNLYFKNLIETQDDLVERQNLLQFNKKEIENLKMDLVMEKGYYIIKMIILNMKVILLKISLKERVNSFGKMEIII